MQRDKRHVHESNESFAQAFMSQIEQRVQDKLQNEAITGDELEIEFTFTVRLDKSKGQGNSQLNRSTNPSDTQMKPRVCCICYHEGDGGVIKCVGDCCDDF